MLADDDRVVRELLLRELERAGFACTATCDAVEAVQHLAEGHYELLVSDVDMPGVSGLYLARMLRSTRPHLPVLLMSGAAGDGVAEAAAAAAGVRAFLMKPFTPQVAVDHVRAILAPHV